MIKPIRSVALLCSAALTCAAILGCHKDYEHRLNDTLERMKYQQRLDANLAAAVEEPLHQPHDVFLRPPITLEKAAGNVLNALPGLFDANISFLESGSDKPIEAADKVHVFVRHKLPTPATPKKGAAPPPALPGLGLRKDVVDDALALFPMAQTSKMEGPRDIDKRGNKFKQRIFTNTQLGRAWEVYSYITPKKDYEVVIVVERADKSSIAEKVNLMLESFAVGDRARKRFGGDLDDSDSGGGEGGGAAVF